MNRQRCAGATSTTPVHSQRGYRDMPRGHDRTSEFNSREHRYHDGRDAPGPGRIAAIVVAVLKWSYDVL